jgi:hypothetical protein
MNDLDFGFYGLRIRIQSVPVLSQSSFTMRRRPTSA